MKWYKLNEDHSVEVLPDGEYPKEDSFSGPTKHIGDTIINDQRISTVFLFFDHGLNFGTPEQPSDPVLFESMIFGGPHDEYQRRYCTYNEALEEERHPDFYFND